jgi:hypothetical protein
LGSLAKSLYRGENVVGGLHPTIGLWILVVGSDEGGDVGLQFGDGAMDTSLQLLSRQFGEPALDLVDPGCGGRREMHMPMMVARQPCLDPWGLMGGVVVHDNMHFGPFGHLPVNLF